MKTFDWRSFAVTMIAFSVGISLGGIVLAQLMHETCHAIACLLFGVPLLSLSWTKATYLTSPNPLVNIFVNLAGGMGQALFSLLFFWLAITLQKRYKSRLQLSGFFGFELAFLTIAFHGVINGVWEGFFYRSYEQIHGNDIVWGTILFLCLIMSLYILKRQSRFLKLKTRENT